MLAAGLVLAGVFVAVERRAAAPLVRLGLLRQGSVVRADLGALLFVGAFFGPLTIAGTDGVAEEEQGLAGGLLTTATQFGSAVGISAVTAVYGIVGGGLSGFRAALVVPVAMVALGAVVGAVGARARTAPAERADLAGAATEVTV
ncbi:hypothetical protein ACGFMM_13500 [Streptomyces sp. NPDC048604]|uniref:hypothetical protein n=1 Tax=Streptomyces sp. NPDC048604 TaxID=3365578 RepID=UPI0037232C74